MVEQFYQRVGTEKVDASPHEIAEAGLSYAQDLSGSSLCETACGDNLQYVKQQVRAHFEVFGFLSLEPEITEHVAG